MWVWVISAVVAGVLVGLAVPTKPKVVYTTSYVDVPVPGPIQYVDVPGPVKVVTRLAHCPKPHPRPILSCSVANELNRLEHREKQ